MDKAGLILIKRAKIKKYYEKSVIVLSEDDTGKRQKLTE